MVCTFVHAWGGDFNIHIHLLTHLFLYFCGLTRGWTDSLTSWPNDLNKGGFYRSVQTVSLRCSWPQCQFQMPWAYPSARPALMFLRSRAPWARNKNKDPFSSAFQNSIALSLTWDDSDLARTWHLILNWHQARTEFKERRKLWIPETLSLQTQDLLLSCPPALWGEERKTDNSPPNKNVGKHTHDVFLVILHALFPFRLFCGVAVY